MSKKRIEYTIADICRNTPQWFLDKQTNQETVTQYITQIRTMLDYGMNHIAPYPLFAVFRTFDISSLSMQDINRMLAEYQPYATAEEAIQKNAGTILARVPFLAHDDILRLCKGDISMLEHELKEATEEYRMKRERIFELQQQIAHATSELAEESAEYDEREEMLADIHDKIEARRNKVDLSRLKMLAALPPQYTVVDVNNNTFTVIRNKPYSMQWTNANTRMCKTVDMGYIGFTLYFATLHLKRAFSVADFIDDRNVHPHISGSHFCFGNVQHRADELREKRDLGGLITLMDSVLQTYSEANPYRRFAVYERKRKERTQLAALTDFTTDIKHRIYDAIIPTCSDEIRDMIAKRKEVDAEVDKERKLLIRIHKMNDAISGYGNPLKYYDGTIDEYIRRLHEKGIVLTKQMFEDREQNVFGAMGLLLKRLCMAFNGPIRINRADGYREYAVPVDRNAGSLPTFTPAKYTHIKVEGDTVCVYNRNDRPLLNIGWAWMTETDFLERTKLQEIIDEEQPEMAVPF